MFSRHFRTLFVVGRVLATGAIAFAVFSAQPIQGQAPAGGGRGGAFVSASILSAADTDKDASVSRAEWNTALMKWFTAADTAKSGSVTQEQLTTAITAALAAAPPSATGFGANGRTRRQARDTDVASMQAALPSSAPAKPKAARKILVLSACSGFVHSCIPLVDRTVEELGTKTKAWTATITYDPADINPKNLANFDLVFLNNTTGAFLDEPNDPGATAARKAALLEFVRSGKGLVGVHAAADSYHQNQGAAPGGARAAAPAAPAAPPAPAGAALATQMIAQGDKNGDAKLDAAETTALSDAWFDKMDADKTGKVPGNAFAMRYASLMPQAPGRGAAGAGRGAPAAPAQGRPGRDTQMATWPEFNRMIGGYFKWHWNDPTHIDYKIDDPNSPLTKMFVSAMPFSLDDETYTFSVNADSYSRTNLHVLTSVDFAKMSGTEKAKQDFPREDDDYGLSWIRREGKGRVFYEAHGHNEKIYSIKTMLEHITAGIQYAMGDLAADDSPSQKR